MKKLGYFLALPLLMAISLLPYTILYLLSNFLFLVLYYIIGYRKKVVFENLKNAFPKSNEESRKKIAKLFYSHLCDLSLETIKTMTMSPASVKKRVLFDQKGVFNQFYKKKQSIIIAMGHYGNWEWAGAGYAVSDNHHLYIIYRPLKDRNFNGMLYRMRIRLGNGLYPLQSALKNILRDREELTATAFIADQAPPPENAHWCTFLNQDTPYFTGIAKIARKLNYPVLYVSTPRIERGKYEVFAEVLCEDPQNWTEQEIIEAFSKRLEKDIVHRPELWLWSHRRWKHSRNNQ